MIKLSSHLFIASLVSAAALHAGCTAQESTLGGSTEALETAYTITFSDLMEGEVVAPNRYSAQGVALESAGGAGIGVKPPSDRKDRGRRRRDPESCAMAR